MIASFLFKGIPETRTPLSIGEFFSSKGVAFRDPL